MKVCEKLDQTSVQKIHESHPQKNMTKVHLEQNFRMIYHPLNNPVCFKRFKFSKVGISNLIYFSDASVWTPKTFQVR